MWVSNSASLRIPCPNGFLTPETTDGTITMIRHDGKATKGPFPGGGLTIPWGIAVAGEDNVWVANFYAHRLSHSCGHDSGRCPPGAKTGTPISPESGYAFDGLTRNTGVAIDRSGNVWLANNWKNQPNPAGKPGRLRGRRLRGARGADRDAVDRAADQAPGPVHSSRERVWAGMAGPVAGTAGSGLGSASRSAAMTARRASPDRFTKARMPPAIIT